MHLVFRRHAHPFFKDATQTYFACCHVKLKIACAHSGLQAKSDPSANLKHPESLSFVPAGCSVSDSLVFFWLKCGTLLPICKSTPRMQSCTLPILIALICCYATRRCEKARDHCLKLVTNLHTFRLRLPWWTYCHDEGTSI